MPITWFPMDAAKRDPRLRSYGLTNLGWRIDPFLAWSVERGLVDPNDFFPVLIQLVDMTAESFAIAIDEMQFGAGRPLIAWIPPWYRRPGPNLRATRFVVAWVTIDFFRALGAEKGPFRNFVERFEFGLSDAPPPTEAVLWRTRKAAGEQLQSAPPAAPFAGRTADELAAQQGEAVLGIVDDGIAFANARFLDRNGTPRVRAFWDQRLPVDVPAFVPKAPVSNGIEWDGDEVQDLITLHRHAGLVDEDELYASCGQAQVGARARHGTHVLDVAAGLDPGSATAPAIVAVQLPSSIAADASGALLAPHLFDGVRYIIDRADRYAEALNGNGPNPGPFPVVVNLSYGLLGGSHDGSSLIESAIADLVDAREGSFDPTRPENGVQATTAGTPYPLSFVIAAGNTALDRCHAAFTATHGSTRTLKWRIPPDSRTCAYLEIWLGHATPDATPSAITVRVIPPVATTNDALAVGPGQCAQLHEGTWTDAADLNERTLVASVSYLSESPVGADKDWSKTFYNDRDMILVAVAPTDGFETDRAWAPSGLWTVEVTNGGAEDIEVHAWIRRNDSPFGSRTGGRQSRFEDDDYRVFDDEGRIVEHDDPASATPIRRTTTLNGIATGRNVLVVGAQRAEGARVATPYTAQGPVVPGAAADAPWRRGPDLLAPADRSAARPGMPGAGTRSGSVIHLNGTSIAAPAFARRLVEQFVEHKAASTLAAYTAAAEALAAPVQAARAPVPDDTERLRSGSRRLLRPYVASIDDPGDP